MRNRQGERDGDPATGGSVPASGHTSDPVATENARLTHAGGPMAGEPGAAGAGFGSGGGTGPGGAEQSGRRTRPSDGPASNEVAPGVQTAMDDDVRVTEEKAARVAGPPGHGA